jgi:ABC-2 type transport system permease protein
MRIELLYFDGCPTYRNTEEALRRVLAEESVEAEVELVAVNSDAEARRLAFPGSPTVRIDGRDPFPAASRGERGLACRVYATPEGMKGTPTAAMIREALGPVSEEVPKRTPLTPGDEEPVELGGVFGLPFRTLLAREVRRFMRVWTQTLLAPLLTSALYILVFGYGLGSRIREAAGVPYLEFILPGLVLMSIITAAYGNTSTSLFDAKRDRYIDDVLISPMTPLQMALAYVLGGVVRGLLVGAGTFVLAMPLAGLPAKHPLLLMVTALAASVIFASGGVVAGVLATRIDHIFFLTNLVIQPLAFLGGIFYSVEMLPDPLRVATYFNPIFYAVDAFRFAALGVSDVPPYPALAALMIFAVLAFLGTTEMLRHGHNLRY